jgi:hypothetical protein
LGYPARREEIRRFGGSCRRVVRVASRQVDDRSFAEVVSMDTSRGFGQNNNGGGTSRLGNRGGPGRFGEERGFERGEGNYRNRDRTNQDLERDLYRGSFGGGMSNFQGGYREERPRFEQSRSINNKRPFEEREKRDWNELELRAKLRRDQEEKRLKDQAMRANQRGDVWKGKGTQNQEEHCFNCNLTGHLRKDCVNPPFCYCCKKPGHRSSVCPEKKGLRLCGFCLPGQGFYSIHVPNDKEVKRNEVLGIMHIQSGQASVGIIERELRHLYRDIRNWNIKQMSEEDRYMVTFPSEEMRYQVAKFKSFEFETTNVKAKVVHTEMSAEVDGKLESVWVRAHRFPTFARKVEVVMEIGYLVGDPEEVDLTTVNKPGPVRIKIACVDVTKV